MGKIWQTYLDTRKARENYWAKYMTRPFAAALVVWLGPTPITPNQVTIIAFLTSLAGAAVMVGWQSWAGLLVSVALYQLAYIFDCVDGMLARVRKLSSPAGHLFDFLMDEIKAVVLLCAVTVRLFMTTQDSLYVLAGFGFVAALSAGLSMTTFTRRPELATPTPSPDQPPGKPPSPLRRALGLVEAIAKFFVNYPGYLVFVALADRIDLYFWIYGVTITVYAAKTFLSVSLRMARS